MGDTRKLGFREGLKAKWSGQRDRSPRSTSPASTSPASISPVNSPSKDPSGKGKARDLWHEAFDKIQRDGKKAKVLAEFQRFILNGDPSLANPTSSALSSTVEPNSIPEAEWRQILVQQANLTRDKMSKAAQSDEKVVKILTAITAAKDALSVAASFEPHAAIVWTCAAAILPFLTSMLKQRSNAISGFEYVSQIMKTHLLHERTYCNSTSYSSHASPGRPVYDVGVQLEEKIVSLYSKILDYQLSMACHFTRGSMRRFLGKVFVLDDWQSMLAGIKTLTEDSRFDMGAIDSSRLDFIYQDTQRVSRREMLSCLASDYEASKEAYPEAAPGSCDWFTSIPRYKAWTVGAPPFLLVTAVPGFGKSVLMKWLVDHTLLNPSDLCTYYFFRVSGSTQHALTHALCSILHQLCLQGYDSVLHLVQEHFDQWGTSLATNLRNLWKILTQAADDGPDDILCFIDALDEASSEGRDKFIQLVNEYYKNPASVKRLKMIISARPYFDREFKFSRLLEGLISDVCVEIMDERPSSELGRIMEIEVDKLDLSPESRRYLLRHLKRKQEIAARQSSHSPTFLWLKLIFDNLRDDLAYQGAGESTIDRLVEDIPEDLNSQYEKLLERNKNSYDRQITRLLLHLILGSTTPLTLRQLQVGLALAQISVTDKKKVTLTLQEDSIFRRRVVPLCGALITTVNTTVYFFHQTVGEFLRSHENPPELNQRYTQLQSQSNGTWNHSFFLPDSNLLWVNVLLQIFDLFHCRNHCDTDAAWPVLLEPASKWLWNNTVTVALLLAHVRHGFIWPDGSEFPEILAAVPRYEPLLDLTDECFQAWLTSAVNDQKAMALTVLLKFFFSAGFIADSNVLDLLQITNKLYKPGDRRVGEGADGTGFKSSWARLSFICQDVQTKLLLFHGVSMDDVEKVRKTIDVARDLSLPRDPVTFPWAGIGQSP